MSLNFKSLRVGIIFLIIIALVIGFGVGFIIKDKFFTEKSNELTPIRLSGYKFVNPLLICDTTVDKKFPELDWLETKINNAIKQESQDNKINKVSIYFQNLKNGQWIEINGDEKFFPASLGKIPVMMAYYKIAEINPNVLDEKIKYDGGTDLNAVQDIKPKDFITAGNSYTVEEIIEKMIKYSDNNALTLLFNSIDQNVLKTVFQSVYKDLQVPLAENLSPGNLDFMTVKQFSFFFRALYNGTYLTKDFSEKALEILNETDFKDGLVAGVPEGTAVSHKFGLDDISFGGNVSGREFHDCGIIYHPRLPYLLCIMTKSSSDVPAIENAVSDISSLVYKEIDTHY